VLKGKKRWQQKNEMESAGSFKESDRATSPEEINLLSGGMN
jgi:hypothetical protein